MGLLRKKSATFAKPCPLAATLFRRGLKIAAFKNTKPRLLCKPGFGVFKTYYFYATP